MVETVFKTIKSECVWRTAFRSREQTCDAIGVYIEGFYDPQRRHSSLGYKSPAAFETAFTAYNRTEKMALHEKRGGPRRYISRRRHVPISNND